MKKFIRKNGLYILVFLVFMVLTFIAGIHHEPWADEAQAWLIAQNCTINDIIFNVLKYEGTPVLWFALLRVLIILHFPYELLFIIPWILSCIGVYLFLFKSKFPFIIKILFPFTFFVFYQYTIAARNYSLVFPLLAIIAINYENRLKRPYLYAFLLILLLNISAYSFIIASVLFCFLIIDTIRYYLACPVPLISSSGGGNFKYLNFQNIIPVICIFICLLLTALTCKKADDCTFLANLNIHYYPLVRFFVTAAKGYFLNNSVKYMPYFSIIITIALYFYSAKVFCRTKYQILFFCFINFSIIFVLSILYCNIWHRGYLILTLIFSCWILADKNNILDIPFKSNEMFYMIFILIFSFQIQNSIQSFNYDIQNNYSGSKQAAKFIKENHLDKEEILGLGYHTVALQPYFKQNIYSNFNKKYWEWKKDSENEYIKKSSRQTPVLVFSTNSGASKLQYYQNRYDIENNYKKFVFKGEMRCGSWSEATDFIIYVKQEKERQIY